MKYKKLDKAEELERMIPYSVASFIPSFWYAGEVYTNTKSTPTALMSFCLAEIAGSGIGFMSDLAIRCFKGRLKTNSESGKLEKKI